MRSFRINLTTGILLAALAAFCAIYSQLLLGNEIFTHDSIIWFGSFHYYVDSMANGQFPYWDPYLMTGTYFYPNISHHGLLEPVVLVFVGLRKLFSISLLDLYIYFRLFRLAFFALGAYYFYRHVTRSAMSALLAAVVLFFAMPASYFKQFGAIDVIYLTPFAMLFLLRYLESTHNTEKKLNLGLLVLVTGISMNIYIPTFYLFNLIVFMVVLLALRIVPLNTLIENIRDKKAILSLLLAGVLVAAMTAPPLLVMLKDASGGGELFPIVRIAQKNDGNLKKIVASDIASSNLSEKFYNEKGVFNSYGNIVNLLYPEMWNLPFFARNDYMAEINQYIGLIPLLLCAIGLLYHRSSYRYLASLMLIIVFFNMFSYEGMSNHPYNSIQRFFNAVFPPLRMAEGRETLGAYFLFYLCLLLGLGVSVLADAEQTTNVLKRHSRAILSLGFFVIIAKIVITGYFGAKIVFASKQDLYALLQVAAFILLIFLLLRGIVQRRTVFIILGVLAFSDLLLYNYLYKVDILVNRTVIPILDAESEGSRDAFQYFRDPIVSPPGVAFGETIVRMKGTLTYGNNHSLFATKRYYDLLTGIPPQNQLALSGTLLPLVRFIPENSSVREVLNKNQLLEYLAFASEEDLLQSVFIETNKTNPGRSAELGSLNSYADVTQFTASNIYRFLVEYSRERGQFIGDMRGRLPQVLNTNEYEVAAKRLTPNEMTLSVHNRQNGFLQYNDGWSKYWKAYDNGREVSVLIANYNAKAVYLTPGDHEVTFVFDPVHYKVGLVLFYCGLAASSVLIILFSVRSRKSQDTAKARQSGEGVDPVA